MKKYIEINEMIGQETVKGLQLKVIEGDNYIDYFLDESNVRETLQYLGLAQVNDKEKKVILTYQF